MSVDQTSQYSHKLQSPTSIPPHVNKSQHEVLLLGPGSCYRHRFLYSRCRGGKESFFFMANDSPQKSVKSELFDWQYELDASASAITTKDEMYATANAWNQTVSIELLDGTMSLVD